MGKKVSSSSLPNGATLEVKFMVLVTTHECRPVDVRHLPTPYVTVLVITTQRGTTCHFFKIEKQLSYHKQKWGLVNLC